MASLRNLLILLGLTSCLEVVTCGTGREYDITCTKSTKDASQEESNCADCNTALRDLFAKAPEFLGKSKMARFNITNPPPCDACEVRGVQNVFIFKDVESKPINCPAAGGDCVDHTLFLEIPHLTGTCFCELDVNPASTVTQMTDVIKKENFGVKCNAPPGVVTQLNKPDPAKSGFDPAKIATLKACLPQLPADLPKVPEVPSLGGFGKRDLPELPPTKQRGNVNVEMKKVQLQVTMRACKDLGYTVMASAKLLNENMDLMDCKCDGPKDFNTPCQCLLDAKFLPMVLKQAVEFIFPCYCDQATEGFEKEMNMLQCLDNFF